MDSYQPVMSFGEDAARNYLNYQRGDEVAAVAFLAPWARGGAALELAIGTGRIALPLAATGIRVDGIDFSAAMLAGLRARPGGAQIAATLGDFADVGVSGSYRLIYIVFNTFFNFLTQDQQVRCFENVAKHLTDDGVFVLEGGMPTEFCRLRNNQYVDLEGLSAERVHLDVARYNPVTQVLEESHVTFSQSGTEISPIVTRYVWPAEMDLMARLAGLRLKERWASWSREPIGPGSRNCVSVYGR